MSVSAAPHPATIHDFYGFPAPLYDLEYAAPGSAELAQRVVDLVQPSGLAIVSDPRRGFDHGVWVPQMLMYPEARIPVVSVSVQPQLPAAHHLLVGELLAPLRDEGVLIVGSGNATHDLRGFRGQPLDAPPQRYAQVFDDWLVERITAGDAEALCDYLRQGPEARRNHPTPDHFLPLFAPLGAAGGAPGRVLHRAMDYGVLAMTALAWD